MTELSRPNARPAATKYGSDAHLVFHEEAYEPEPAKHVRELFRPFMIRQWVNAGKLHRDPSPREVPRVELFFDLLFVAVVHQLAEAAIEEPGGAAVARFILTFWPSWSIWEEARKYSNLLHRIWILVGMICILGYTANASAIELHQKEEEDALDHTAIRAAVAFWLIIKLSRVLVLFLYAWRLPRFRQSQFLQGLAVLIPMFFYLPLVWVESRRAQIILASLGIVVDMCRFDLIFFNLLGRLHLRRLRRENPENVPAGPHWHKMPALPEGVLIPAMSIEHAIDRSGAFVVIVLGELVMNLVYTATHSDIGASSKFGRAALGLMVAWAINYLYMIPSEPNNNYEHALRRSWLSGISFSTFHWPLCASLVLASAACGEMMKQNELEEGIEWYWGGGLGAALIFLALIDVTHRNLADWREARIPRYARSAATLVGGILLILFPVALPHTTAYPSFAWAVVVTWVVLIIHIIGMLPRPSVARRWEREERDGEGEGVSGGMADTTVVLRSDSDEAAVAA